MRLFTRPILAVTFATCLAALSGCGGGDSPAEVKSAVDAYAGTWSVCIKSSEPGKARREQYTFKKITATTGESEFLKFDYGNETCSGEPEGWNGNRDFIEWTGETQVVDSQTMDKIIIESGTVFSSQAPAEVPADPVTTEYQVVTIVNGNQLRIGTFSESNLQTYPEHLWSEVLLRQ